MMSSSHDILTLVIIAHIMTLVIRYLMEEGAAAASIGRDTVKEYTTGDHFGELALLHSKPRAATVTATAPCKCMKLDRAAFERVAAMAGEALDAHVHKYVHV